MKRLRLLGYAGLSLAYAACFGSEILNGASSNVYYEMSLEDLLEVKVVTAATGSRRKATLAPSISTVITAEDLRLTGALEIEDALEVVPGMHVMHNPVSYYNPIFSLRGIQSVYNPEMLVLINGVPVNMLYTGGPILVGGGTIPVSMVERIEVISGPGSALYGADAYAGVINIITKTASDIGGTLGGMRAGSFNTREVWGQYGERHGDTAVSILANYSETRGSRRTIREDRQAVLDQRFGTSASLAPAPTDIPRQALDVDLAVERGPVRFHTLYQRRENVGMVAGVVGALPRDQENTASGRLYSDLTVDLPDFSRDWGIQLRAIHVYTQYDTKDMMVYPPGAVVNGTSFPVGMWGRTGVREQLKGGELVAVYEGFENHRWRFGTGYRRSEILDVDYWGNYGVNPKTGQTNPPVRQMSDLSGPENTFLPTGFRDNFFALAQDEWKLTRSLELVAGLRYDHYSDFGGTWNPRAALIWQANSNWTARLLYGRAFRAPSYQEMYQKNNPIAMGDPDLNPETMDMLEADVEYRTEFNTFAGVNTYYYLAKDIITFQPDPFKIGDQSLYAVNAGSQRGAGASLRVGGYLADDLALSAHYAFCWTQDQDCNPSVGAPRQDAYVRADWIPLKNWHLNIQSSWILDRPRAAGDPRKQVGDYVSVDTTLNYRRGDSPWSVWVSVRNLFDADIREPASGPDSDGIISMYYDAPMAGRAYYAGVEYLF